MKKTIEIPDGITCNGPEQDDKWCPCFCNDTGMCYAHDEEIVWKNICKGNGNLSSPMKCESCLKSTETKEEFGKRMDAWKGKT